MTPARWAALAALAFAFYFAVQGGEYGTTDLLQLRDEERQERTEVARLQHVVDSLARAAKAIENDPRTQERVARESFGMIRKGEFLFRLVPGDSLDR
ncbi:MAG TPA: septum formation initiator family protein [Gemmatimonadales bacterium]